MFRDIVFLLSFSTLLAGNTFSQRHSRTICGQLTSAEDGTPLEGVLVVAKCSGLVTGTLLDGMFYLPVTEKDTCLMISREGLVPMEVRLTSAMDYSTSIPSFSPIGAWAGFFQLRPDVEAPVAFDIHADNAGVLKVFFHNGEESFDGGRVIQRGDSLFLLLEQFDNELVLHIGDSALTGFLRRQDGTGNFLPVKMVRSAAGRFAGPGPGTPPAGNLTGTYAITFRSDNGKEEKTVGLLRQDGNKLQGTFLRVTGDARYLEGRVEGDHFYLTSFIGSIPSYYKGSFTSGGQLKGESIGPRGSIHFSGIPDAQAALPDPYTLTWVKKDSTFNFSFPDIDGHPVNLHDEKFRNKVVIVTIGGTWCPNCIDEASFLSPWYTANHNRGIEVVSIFYERRSDPAYVKKALLRFRERFNIQYTQVFGGLADKQGVAASLPALNTFIAFPTTIVIDRKGRVVRIHTGYSGPATGKYYEQFIKQFDEEVTALNNSPAEVDPR